VKLPELNGDRDRGGEIYSLQCAQCHGAEGAGNPPAIPAGVWGPNAYDGGAGMNDIAKMAAFVQHNMPKTDPDSLTPQEAYDVATYINSKPLRAVYRERAPVAQLRRGLARHGSNRYSRAFSMSWPFLQQCLSFAEPRPLNPPHVARQGYASWPIAFAPIHALHPGGFAISNSLRSCKAFPGVVEYCVTSPNRRGAAVHVTCSRVSIRKETRCPVIVKFSVPFDHALQIGDGLRKMILRE